MTASIAKASSRRSGARRRTSSASPRARKPAPTAPKARLLGCSDAAITKATGKPWAHWLRVLDRFDVKRHGHAEAANHLHQKHHAPDWWSQMIVVGYERVRGLRLPRQKTDGFSASASVTISGRSAGVLTWFSDARRAAKWLPEGVVVHKTGPKAARMTWRDGTKVLSVSIAERRTSGGETRTSVQVQHDRISSERECARMKRLWSAALDRLRAAVNHGR